jgi:PAS domain S-box-containing protein
LLTAFVLAQTYFTFVQPNLAVRSLNVATGMLIICFQCLWLLLFGVEPGMRRLTLGVGLIFGAFCLVNLIRIIAFFIGPQATSDYLEPGIFEPLILASYQILFVLLTYGLVLMFNKRLLSEVKAQEEKFYKAFHSSPYAIALTRLSDGCLIEVNAVFLKITGYSNAELLGKTTNDLHLWDNEEDRSAMVKEMSETGRVQSREFQFRNKSGETVTGLFSAETIVINDEAFILSSINDITERKQAEVEREKLILELRQALAKVNQLSGLLPICASCKKVRDDNGYWMQIESYIRDHSEADFSHSICPECAKDYYTELANKKNIPESKY